MPLDPSKWLKMKDFARTDKNHKNKSQKSFSHVGRTLTVFSKFVVTRLILMLHLMPYTFAPRVDTLIHSEGTRLKTGL